MQDQPTPRELFAIMEDHIRYLTGRHIGPRQAVTCPAWCAGDHRRETWPGCPCGADSAIHSTTLGGLDTLDGAHFMRFELVQYDGTDGPETPRLQMTVNDGDGNLWLTLTLDDADKLAGLLRDCAGRGRSILEGTNR